MDAIASIQGLSDRYTRNGVALRFVDLGQGEGFALATVGASGAGAAASILAGQLTTSTTAAPLEAIGSGHVCSYVVIQNDPASVVTISVGTENGQDTVLQPGEITRVDALNTSQVYAVAASGTPKADWLAGIAAGATVASMSTTAAALGTNTCTEVLLQADLGNLANILIGDSSHQYLVLTPGASIRLQVANSNLIYAKAAAVATGVTLYYTCLSKL